MVNESKYVYKGEKSSLVLPILFMIAIVGVASYFSLIAGAGILLLYLLILIIRVFKIKAFLRNLEIIDEEENIEVYTIVKDLSDFFNINLPRIAIMDSEYVEVFAFGLSKPYYLVVSSTALRFLNKKELTFAIGQELGNIHRGKARTLSLISPNGNIGFLDNILFGRWQKKVEAASDRLGLLMNADIDAAISVLIKACYEKADLRRLDIYSTLRAITSLKRSQLENLNNMLDLDDYTIKRIINLIKYSRSKEYRGIVSTATFGLYSKDAKPIGYADKIEVGEENVCTQEKKEEKIVNDKIGISKDENIINSKMNTPKEENIINSKMNTPKEENIFISKIDEGRKEKNVLDSNMNGDETKVFTQNEINQIKNRSIKLSEDIIKKHSLEENIKKKEEKLYTSEKNIEIPKKDMSAQEGNIFEKLDVVNVKNNNYNDNYGNEEVDELYELEPSNTKKLIIVLSVLLVVLIGGMFVFKKVILTNTNGNKSNIIDKNEEEKEEEVPLSDDDKIKIVAENVALALKNQPVEGVTYKESVKEDIEDIKVFGEITNVEIKETKVKGDIAYIRTIIENGEEGKDVILALNKANEEWEVNYIVNDKNLELTLEEAYNQNYDRSTFNTNYEYKKQSGGFNEDIKTSQRLEGIERTGVYYIIEKFNDEWVEYVNTGDKDGISELVKENSWASALPDRYKRTGIKQKYLKHKINDIRKGNDYYYVWINEKIEESKQGNIQIREYEWVYTIEKVEDKFTIVEYIWDPEVR